MFSPLVDEEVGVLAVLLLDRPVKLVIYGICSASETLLLKILDIEHFDDAIVELQPLLVLRLDKTVVVPVLCPSIMDHYAHQVVHVVGPFLLLVRLSLTLDDRCIRLCRRSRLGSLLRVSGLDVSVVCLLYRFVVDVG